MESLREYLLSIVAVCMLTAVASVMVKNALPAKVLRLVSGVLILLVVVAPLAKTDLEGISEHMRQAFFSDTVDTDNLQEQSRLQLAEQIQSATQDHIEQIAARLGMLIQAEVRVNDAQIPVPIEVEIFGTVDVEQMSKLSKYIETNIGIPMENQKWRDHETNS